MQLAVQQPDLSQMFGQDSLYSTLYGLQRQQQANDAQNQNLLQAQQDTAFQAQDQPFNNAQLAANVGHTQALTGLANAQIPGAQAESTLKQNSADVDSSIPLSTKRSAAISKIAAGMTKDDADAHEAQARTDLFSPDPVKRKNAQMVLDNMPEVRAKMREIAAEGENSARVAGITAASNQKINSDNIAAGKYNKNSLEFMMAQAKAKANFQQQAGIANSQMNDALQAAQQAEDPDEKQFYLSKAADFKKQKDEAILNDYRAKQAAGTAANAGKLNVAPLAGGENVVDPASLPPPPQVPQDATPSPTASSMVPMKDKNGVPHLVPKANVQRALQGGWTQ